MSNKQFKVVITESIPEYKDIKSIANVYQNSNPGALPRDILLKETKDADGIVCLLRDKIDKEFLDNAKALKVISTLSVGYDHIDLEECKKRGIKVGNTPDVLTAATAELAVSLTLAVSRRLIEAADAAKSGGWKIWSPFWMCGRGIQNSTIGIFGLGRIGSTVAKLLEAFGPESIIYHNRNPKPECKYQYVSSEDLLSRSDYLIVCVDASTIKGPLFNIDAFKQMKKSATFINVSRGMLVDHDHLYKALSEGIIGSAGLDVTNPEPFPLDHPLFTLNNCVILPHIGSATVSTREAMINLSESNLINGLTGKPIIGPIQ